MTRGTLGVCVFVGLAVVSVVALGGAAIGTADATEDTQNTSLGADISSFMQASSAETTNDVEEGTFEAALNRTEDPDERRALIEARQQRLQERSERLRAQHEGLGNASDVRNRSIATRISAGAAGLERSANRTETVAVRNGVDTDQLDEIRSNARSLRGPETAELARSVAGPSGEGPPGGNRTGPPNETRSGPPNDDLPGPSEPPTDANNERATDARDAERGPPDTEPGRPADVGGPPDADNPSENSDRPDSAANGNAASNSSSSSDHSSENAPGQPGARDRSGSAGAPGSGPSVDPRP